MQGIYAIENVLNGKKYIGQSVTIEKRIKRHFRELEKGSHHNPYLQNSFNKHGKDNFIHYVIEEVQDRSMLDEREMYWIEEHNSMYGGYNRTLGGGGDKGMIVTDEFREMMRQIVIGENNPNYGHHWTQEMKDNLSKKKKGTQTGGDNPRAVKVIRVEDCKVYDCMDDAAKELGLSSMASISRCLKNIVFEASGFHFCEYTDENYEFFSNWIYRTLYLRFIDYLSNKRPIFTSDCKKSYSVENFKNYINKTYNIPKREIDRQLKTQRNIQYGNEKFINLKKLST